MQKIKLATGRLARWSLKLQEYRFIITHCPGTRNQNADALSRPYGNSDTNNTTASNSDDDDEIIAVVDATDSVIIENQVPPSQITQTCEPSPDTSIGKTDNPCNCKAQDDTKKYTMVRFEYPPQNTKPCIAALSDNEEGIIQRPDKTPKIENEELQSVSDLQWACPELSPYLLYLVNGTLPSDDKKAKKLVYESENYVVVDNVLYHYTSVRSSGIPKPMPLQRTLAVPTPLREDVLLCYHDGPGGSHFGFDKTYSSIKAKYYWPFLFRDVENHIKSCDPFQKGQ